MAQITGGEALVRMLEAHGVELAFGMGGFQALPYYDALARREQVRHVLIRDEKHGAFAADGYARITNRPAVVDATLGPGATNLVSGLAESFGASLPLIALTGEVNSGFAGRGGTQESDQVGMLTPTSKESITIRQIERIPELMRRAVSLATGGRPGPVHVNVPEEVFHASHEFSEDSFVAHTGSEAAPAQRARPTASAVDQAVEILRRAERPVAVLGGGIHLSQAYREVQRLADLGIPVATTISGKGALPDTDPMSIGISGRYSRSANELIESADAILVVGSKLGEIATKRWTVIPSRTKIIHIDIDADELGRYYTPTVPMWADARDAFRDLNDALRAETRSLSFQRQGRQDEIAAAKAQWQNIAAEKAQSDERPITMPRLLADLRATLPDEAILVADGGFAAHWSGLFWDVPVAGRTYIANRGHAAIGYGVPGALGAKLAAPDKPVVALCGDNGFAMAMSELETLKRCGTPVICVIVNNAALGYVKALQHALYSDRFLSVDFEEVDYAAVAEAHGCVGIRVDDPAELKGAFASALAHQETDPVVLDIRTTTDPAEMLPGADSRTAQSAA